MKLRYASILLFGLMLSQPVNAAQPAQEASAPKNAAQEADSWVHFEYVIASLAADTYDLIDRQKQTEYHPYLELSPKQKKIVNRLETFFYKKGNFDALARSFKHNKEDGVAAVLSFFKEVARIIHVDLPSCAGLVLQEEKLDWLKKSYKSIKKQYKTFEPRLKSEGIANVFKRALILNPATRYLNLEMLAKLLSDPTTKMATIFAAGFFTGPLRKKDEDKIYQAKDIFTMGNLKGFGILFAVNAAIEALSGFLRSLEKDKEELFKRDQFAQYSEEQKKIKDQLYGFISHMGTGEGFSTIKGIQNENTIRELSFFANWLRKPISYHGNKLAIMLYGEPGNGKGIITKALADESKTPMITISAFDVKNERVGTKLWAAEKLAQSRDAKSIIVFFDEIDLILPKDDPAALQAFLTFLDGTQKSNPHVRVLYVFATNYIQKLDPRLLRPGRFKSKIYVGPPTKEQRAELITATLLSIFKEAPQELVEVLVAETDGLSRVAIDESIVNTYNHAILTEEMPSVESFSNEIKQLKEIAYHCSEQIA